jgi:histidine ammonia-lyase
MINAARRLARRGDLDALCAKVQGAPLPGAADYPQFREDCAELLRQLALSGEFAPAAPVAKALARVRHDIPFMSRDRAMDGEVRRMCELVETDAILRSALA